MLISQSQFFTFRFSLFTFFRILTSSSYFCARKKPNKFVFSLTFSYLCTEQSSNNNYGTHISSVSHHRHRFGSTGCLLCHAGTSAGRQGTYRPDRTAETAGGRFAPPTDARPAGDIPPADTGDAGVAAATDARRARILSATVAFAARVATTADAAANGTPARTDEHHLRARPQGTGGRALGRQQRTALQDTRPVAGRPPANALADGKDAEGT